jgi:ring-1,2-phenylacetyl-CoA epoxidase subunit PaaD
VSGVAPAPTATVAEAIARIPDPEVPVITIEDLGILRSCEVDDDTRTLRVVITPTYSGCPAMDVIRHRIAHEAARAGYTAAVDTRLSPAWTTDWMSETGKERLRAFGIAPPTTRAATGPVTVGLSVRQVACPLCGAHETEEIARFGSTACKALRRCTVCREPFDEFKAI